MGKQSLRKYTREFKRQAAELAIRIGSTRAAEQLGVPLQSVNTWKLNSQRTGVQTKKEKVNLEEENRLLRKEVDELKKVNQILKRAAAFFSQDHLK